MRKRAIWVAVTSIIAALAVSAAFAGAAGAAPHWKANGTELTSPETVVAEAPASTVTLSTLATTCKATIGMTIANTTGFGGVVNVESMTLSGCATNGACTVTAANAAELPWGGASLSIGGNPYLKILGFDNRIKYASCAISGITFRYQGNIGGLFDNANSTLTFNAETAAATNSEIHSAGETETTYSGVWNLQMTGAHAGQTLTLS
jgi:hypothetical protein